MLFHHIPDDHECVEYFCQCHQKLFYEDHNLKWLVSTNAVYLTNTRVLFSDKYRLKDTEKAIEFAKDKVLSPLVNSFSDVVEHNVI
jgi:hypothetical protein